MPITRTLSEAVAERIYLLNEPTAGSLKQMVLKITKELSRPPDATSSSCFPTAEHALDIKDESEVHTVDNSEDPPIFVLIELSNFPQFEP